MTRINEASLKGQKLLILDGSRKAIDIITQAHELGVHVIVSDYNDPEDSPAKLYADEHFQVSIADVDAVVNLIHEQNISGVLPGFSDRWLPTYAVICERAGLPAYASVEQLELFTDKKRYKELLEKHGVPVIEGFSKQQAENQEIPQSAFPVVVKPADGSGSRGITYCSTQEELHTGISDALEYSWTNELVIERFIEGQEATVYWIFRDGEYFVSMVANRHMASFENSAFRLPVAYSSPSYLAPEYLKDIAPAVRSMLRSENVQDGMMFMQGIITDGVFRTYDIGFRPTPTQEYRVLEHLCGYNPLKMLIRFAVTGHMGNEDLNSIASPLYEGFGFNVSLSIKPGKVAEYRGLETTRELNGVLSVSCALGEGELLPAEARGQLRQIAVRVIGVANSFSELGTRIDEVRAQVDVLAEDGSSLLIVPDEEFFLDRNSLFEPSA